MPQLLQLLILNSSHTGLILAPTSEVCTWLKDQLAMNFMATMVGTCSQQLPELKQH